MFLKNITAEYCIIDMSRNYEAAHYPWGFMENVKNGMLSSTKYDSVAVELPQRVKMVVMTNQEVEMTKLSADRYEIYKI